MTKFMDSKFGAVLSGIYLLFVLYAALEGCNPPPKPMDGFAMLILTAPWSFILLMVLENGGIVTENNGDAFLPIYVIVGGLVNASILYFLGYLLTKLFAYFSSGKKE